MAYEGGIDFLDLPLGGIDWFTDAIRSPWAPEGANSWHTGDGRESVELKAEARPLVLGNAGMTAKDEVVIIYDSPGMIIVEGNDLMCVVVGREKKHNAIGDVKHFFLVVEKSREPLGAWEGGKWCQRVGVGYMKGRLIDQEFSTQAIIIR